MPATRLLLPALALTLLLGEASAGVLGPGAGALPRPDSGWIAVQANDPAALARLEVRLGRLEEELRRMNGRLEEVEFAQRRINARIDQLVADLDARLAALEGEGASGETRNDSSGEPPEQSTAGADDPPVVDAPVAPEGSLGTVADSDVAALPRPDPAGATAPERDALSPDEQYQTAIGLLRRGDYAGAEQGLEVFLEVNPDDPLAANAAYWLAETHYVREEYGEAAAAFARNYGSYGSDAPKAPDNLLKLGMALHQLGRDDEACRAFAELGTTFPDAPAHIRQALERERDAAGCNA